MANPMLNDATLKRAGQAWDAPDVASRSTVLDAPGGYGAGSQLPPPQARTIPPINDGPISRWDSRSMTVNGTITATGVLMVLLLGSAVAGWVSVKSPAPGVNPSFPPLALVGVIVGFAAVIALYFKPQWAKILGPVYAVAEGYFLGVISKAYETFQKGIVLQAVGATLGVFLVMLVLYKTQILKVTDKFRKIVIGATLGLMLFYLVSFVIRLIAGAGSVSFLNSASGLGIAFSVFAAGLAALNLALDFDFIEKGAANRLPKNTEWFAAVGLLVTLVWLYLELLRLLSKLQRN